MALAPARFRARTCQLTTFPDRTPSIRPALRPTILPESEPTAATRSTSLAVPSTSAALSAFLRAAAACRELGRCILPTSRLRDSLHLDRLDRGPSPSRCSPRPLQPRPPSAATRPACLQRYLRLATSLANRPRVLQ